MPDHVKLYIYIYIYIYIYTYMYIYTRICLGSTFKRIGDAIARCRVYYIKMKTTSRKVIKQKATKKIHNAAPDILAKVSRNAILKQGKLPVSNINLIYDFLCEGIASWLSYLVMLYLEDQIRHLTTLYYE